MLRNLRIENFAILDELEIELGDGLNVFTGETGAGKSILIEAFGFLMGSRGNPDWLRNRGKLRVEGDFDSEDVPKPIRDEFGIRGGKATLRRELDHSGRSRAFLNDKPLKLSALAGVGEALVDFHGQHENQSLLQSKMQLELLDRYAGLEDLRGKTARVFAQRETLRRQIEGLELSEEEKARRKDLYRFQIADIEEAGLRAGEEEELQESLPKLRNADRLRRLSADLYGALRRNEKSADETLSEARRCAEELAELDPQTADWVELLSQASAAVEEAANRAREYGETVSADPTEIDRILGRLDLLGRLKKKYGPDVPSILEYLERIREELDGLEDSGARAMELGRELSKIEGALAGLCDELHEARMEAGRKLSRRIVKDLKALGMPQARFSIAVEMEEGRFTAWGSDRVTYLFSSNPGEAMKGVSAVASGGELARVMLALKALLARQDRISVLVFDEVDTGVGGVVARAVGDKLAEVSRAHQVLCVTHLPQIACFGASHFRVAKDLSGGRTTVKVEPLLGKLRMDEVARMLGGTKGLTRSSRDYARELLKDIQGG